MIRLLASALQRYTAARIDFSSTRHASPNDLSGSASAPRDRMSARISSTERLVAKYCSVIVFSTCSAAASTESDAQSRMRLTSSYKATTAPGCALYA